MFQFIDSIADHIIENYRDDLGQLKVLFPNHRAVLFLRKRLAEKMDEAYINPEMRSVDSMVNDHCQWVVPERISLIHSLYETMQELYDRDETFAHFYSWGDKLLNDFDLIDKNLVDAGKLFKSIDDIQEIEDQFGHLEEETQEILTEFWGKVKDKKDNNWAETWEHSGEMYFAFANKLKKLSRAYPGMKYRFLAENLHLLDEWESGPVIIAGFNRLSASEYTILNHLKHADFFWDVDKYYYTDERHSAGKYMRKYIRKFGIVNDLSDLRTEEDKDITVLNIPKSHTQSQAAMQYMNDQNWAPEKTMVLLADENQLLPLLTIIPDEISDFNISMGWHVSESPIATFIDRILELHLEYNREHEAYLSLQVLNLLRHNYIQKLIPENVPAYRAEKEWTRTTELEKYGKVYEIIFEPLDKKLDIFDRLISFTEELYRAEENIEREEDEEGIYLKGSGVFLAEVLKYVHQKLLRLGDIFQPLAASVNLQELTYLFRQIFRNTRIPFSGEPLTGMQILGPLEARSLDYDNVVIFNMREGSWPPTFRESTIPFSLRKAYGIPVIEDEVAEYSYYFWSLIARTENVLLLNPDDTAVFDVKGKSRFLLELETLKNDFINYRTLSVEQDLKVAEERDIVIEKDAEIMRKIQAMDHFSASSLLAYSACSLRFYFSKILEIRESDVFDPEYDPAKFGTVFHNTMESLYSPYAATGEVINDNVLHLIKEQKSDELRKEYKKEYLIEDFQMEQGRHLFYLEVLEKYIDNILEYDKKRVPFQVLDCERKILPNFVYDKSTGETTTIKGFIDRIDKKDDTVYIIDYKTGKVSLSGQAEDIFTEKKVQRNRNVLQVLFYALLMQEDYDKVEPQLFGVRNVSELDKAEEANLRLKRHSKTYDLDYSLDVTEEGFSEKIKEIYNPEVPFRKTEEEKNCVYCDFNFICNR